jgi:PAS domain S-box-containing protein
MPEMISIARDELERLEERARKGALDKSYLQLIIRLMNQVSAASGLEGMVECMLRNILDVIGGNNIILYYWIDHDIFYADVFGKKMKLAAIEDDLVRRVLTTREAIELDHAFSDTMMLTPEFTKAYTWVFPLLVGPDLIGVFKLESLHIGMRGLYNYLPTFFSFVALVIKNEILGYTRLQQAHDRLSMANAELTTEIHEREETEEALRKAKNQLEERVVERTAELRAVNERLRKELAELELAQTALRRSTEETQDLYDHAPCGYHSLDRDGTFIRMNDTELQWLGYARDEVLGKMRFSDLLTERSLQIFLVNFPLFKERGWVRDLEFEMVRRDGSILPVLLSATVVYDDRGGFLMSRSTIYDITERRKAEEQDHRLSAIVQSSDDAILSKDLKGSILSWNKGAERVYGYGAEEALGKPVSMLIPPDRPEELTEILARVGQGERVEHFTTERIRKDGQRISLSLTVSPIRDTSGRIVGASSIARDITEQMRAEEEIIRLNAELEHRVESRTSDLNTKRTELEEIQQALMNIVEDLNEKTGELERANAKLKELDRLKAIFIASMSHELRTPLNSIIGFSSILRDEWSGPINSEQRENLSIVLRCGKHLLNLINDVIDVSKIETGGIETIPQEFDLYDLVDEVVKLLKRELENKGLDLRVAVPHQQMHTDRQRLMQCALNLLSNAIKYTEQGSVTVEARITNGPGDQPGAVVAEICVTDTGIGIRDEDLPKMFQPFVRLSSPLQLTVSGTGLGLYLTRKLAANVLKGDVMLTTEPGQGSRFTLRIPVRVA